MHFFNKACKTFIKVIKVLIILINVLSINKCNNEMLLVHIRGNEVSKLYSEGQLCSSPHPLPPTLCISGYPGVIEGHSGIRTIGGNRKGGSILSDGHLK